MKVVSRHSDDSELSFRGIIHIVCQTNERGGKFAGARNIAFSSASSKKEESVMCVAIPSPPRSNFQRIVTGTAPHRFVW